MISEGNGLSGLQDGKFDIGGGDRFDTLPELVEYYKKTPIVETSGNVVHLRYVSDDVMMTSWKGISLLCVCVYIWAC